jgi:hydrogenase/urease accessory protein HupE
MPSDPGIVIAGQSRSYDQSHYRLDFKVDGRSANSSGRAAAERSWSRSDRLALVRTYFWHGVRHILTGYDHLLFVAALVFGAATLWDLIKVVTAFTAAHSITLSLAALGFVHVPSSVVEPVIAASIVAVAAQNIFQPSQMRGASRLLIAFLFGLFHGLGFASGLREIMHTMPTAMILLAILGFSLGVEAGNQVVLLPLFGALRSGESLAACSVPALRIRQIGSGAILVAGIWYLAFATTASN